MQRKKSRRKQIMAAIFNDNNFEQEVMQAKEPVMVDFYADWCNPCKMMAPIVNELAEEYAGRIKIGKVNVDESPDSAAKFRIMSIPTIVLLVNGEVKDTIVGVVQKSELIRRMEAVL